MQVQAAKCKFIVQTKLQFRGDKKILLPEKLKIQFIWSAFAEFQDLEDLKNDNFSVLYNKTNKVFKRSNAHPPNVETGIWQSPGHRAQTEVN